MSAILRVYNAVVYEKNGVRYPSPGSFAEPVAEFSAAGLDHVAPRHVVIPAGTFKTVWSYGIPVSFDLATLRILEAGMTGHMHWRVDRPTDRAAGDLSPSGDLVRWRHKMLRGQTPEQLSADDGLIDSDAGDDNGDAAGEPAILTSGTSELGHIYEIGVSNPGETDFTVEFASYH
jgi:hypothetical protein